MTPNGSKKAAAEHSRKTGLLLLIHERLARYGRSVRKQVFEAVEETNGVPHVAWLEWVDIDCILNAQGENSSLPILVVAVPMINAKDQALIVAEMAKDDFDEKRNIVLVQSCKDDLTLVTTLGQQHRDKNYERPVKYLKCAGCTLHQPGAKKCSRCLRVSYCSVRCQRSHWKKHRLTCVDSTTL
jgi:hypothetical protein